MIRTEEAQRRKEEIAYEKQAKKLFLVNRAEIKQQAVFFFSFHDFLICWKETSIFRDIPTRRIQETDSNEMVIRHGKTTFFSQSFWKIKSLYSKTSNIKYEKDARIADFRLRMRNKAAAKIQIAYRKHMERYGKTAIEKKTKHIRE